MKKNVPVLIAIGIVILIVAVAVALSGRKAATVTTPGGQKVVADPMQRQKMVKAEMQKAQAAYDAKDYQTAITTTQGILSNIDNMSQEAKNLLQVSQIAVMNERQMIPVAAEETVAP